MTLSCWAETLGGIENLKKIKSIYQKIKVEMGGLTGSVEEWFTIQGQHCQKLDLGIYKTLTVFDGKTAWIKDQNGLVRELFGPELENEFSAIYLGTFSQFFNYLPGNIEQRNPMILKPVSGKPVSIFFDQNNLPTHYEQLESERIQTTYLSDWRTIDGVLFPFSLRQRLGDGHYDTVFIVEEIQLNHSIKENLFEKPIEDHISPFIDGTNAIDIPFKLNNGHIYLQIRVNNSEPLWFIFDTGAASSVIDADIAKKSGLELQGQIEGRGIGEGSVDVALLNATFSLVNIRTEQTIAAIALKNLEIYVGHRIDGILGYDFIRHFVTEIDYENCLISFFDPKTYQYQGSAEILPISLENNHPNLQAEVIINGQSFIGYFLIDTGDGSSIGLNKPFIENNKLNPKMIDGHPGRGVGGEAKSKVGRIEQVKLGKSVVENVVTSFAQDNQGSGADPHRIGSIGGEVFCCFKMIINYHEKYIVFEPNKNFGELFEYGMSGLSLITDKNFKRFYIDGVLKNSPAAEIGLHKGDEIIKLNDQSAGNFTLDQMREFLKEKDGKEVKVEVKRNGELIQTTLRLRRLI